MKDKTLQLLLVEDDQDDYLIMDNYLSELMGWNIEHHWVDSPDIALEKSISQPYDICFVDYMLGGGVTGIELVKEMQKAGFEAPIIILTGKGSRKVDLMAMQLGISDYIEKHNLNAKVIERSIRYALERANNLKALFQLQRHQQSLSQQLLNAQEHERKIVAQELHDSIGSSLAAIKFALESKLDRIYTNKPWQQGIQIETIIDMAREVLDETRRISCNLRPPTLDSMGILVTIESMCREFQTVYHKFKIERDIQVQETDVPEYLKIIIYRILQEALANAAKHSGADTIRIDFFREGSLLKLNIADNGQGFVNGELEKSQLGIGLQSIRDRCELSNCQLNISAPAGVGMNLSLAWSTEPPSPC